MADCTKRKARVVVEWGGVEMQEGRKVVSETRLIENEEG